MKKRFSILTLVVAILVSALVASLISYGAAYRQVHRTVMYEGSTDGMAMLDAVDYAYRNYYYTDIDEEALEEGLITGYIYGAGDRYGEYMTPEAVAEFTQDNNGENVGIGVSVIFDEEVGLLEIINVVPDSPAEEAGVAIGDYIYTIDGEDAYELGYYGSLDAMAGTEGSTAVFTVMRGDEEVAFSIVRRSVTQINVSGHMYSDGKIGIIRIEEFDTATVSQFKEEVERLTEAGAEKLVFDVRNNPGGELESIVSILDYLLPEGPIIRIEDKDGEDEVRYSDAEHLDIPMAVLINENTASAAELFSSALQDYEAAILVGKTSYGKGCMQSIIPLIDGSALRITVSLYKPPYSDNYDGIGVVPDVDCDMAEDVRDKSLYKLTDQEDTQLMRAIEELNK